MYACFLMAWLFFSPGNRFEVDDYSGKDLSQQNFSDRDLVGAKFVDAMLFLTTFNHSNLTGADFREADLTSASFTGTNLTKADFRKAIFKYTSMQEADLSGANFQDTDLNEISFQKAKLRRCNLRHCKRIGDVQNADLREADLRGAVFTCTAYYMNGCRLEGAKFDQKTLWPKGFQWESSGAVLEPLDEEEMTRDNEASSRDEKKKPAESPNLEAEELTEDIVKYLLETRMWGSKDGKGFQYKYHALKLASPRKGDFRTDGTPANKDVTVVPVRVRVDVIHDLGNNDSRMETKDQHYVFFRDEFETWTFSFLGNRE